MYLQRRDDFNDDNCYYDAFNHLVCNNSAWDNWIRWVVLAVVIVIFFLLFVLCSCITARRRRRMGQQPFYGTGWATRPGGQSAPYYHNQPAPPYSATPAANDRSYYGNANNPPYYAAHQPGQYELQSPSPTYTGNQQYAPPPGPPPTKGQSDGVIR